MDVPVLIQFLILLAMVIAGCWTVYIAINRNMAEDRKNNQAEIEKLRTEHEENMEDLRRESKEDQAVIFRRMDENKKSYYEAFVDNKLYDNDQKHMKERQAEKIDYIMTFFKDKIEGLERLIKDLKETVKDNARTVNNHQQP